MPHYTSFFVLINILTFELLVSQKIVISTNTVHLSPKSNARDVVLQRLYIPIQKSLTEPYCNINDKQFLDKYCDLLLVQKQTEAICDVFFDSRKKYTAFLRPKSKLI